MRVQGSAVRERMVPDITPHLPHKQPRNLLRDEPADNGVREVSKGPRPEVSLRRNKEGNRASHRGTRSGELAR